MHMIMALLQNICKYKGCAQKFKNLVDLIHHIEDTHVIDFIPLGERSQPACLPLSCILPYNPPCETVAPTVGASAPAKGSSDSGHRDKTGVSTVWASAPPGGTMTASGGNATNNQPSEVTTGNSASATTATVNGSGHGLPGAVANATSDQKAGVSGVSGSTSESPKTSSLNQPSGTADLKRKIAIKHHSYSISSSNRSTTPTGSELDDDDMMVSESEDSNDSWTTEEFSSEFIMRYGSRRHSSSGAGNGSNSSNEKPFACPVPGCKKRYKNVNGIKYHSKNGHKKDGNRVRKGFKCFCGKSYKTNQRLKIHNMLSHAPGWPNTTAAAAAAANSSATSSSSGSVSVGPLASACESDISTSGLETISLASSVPLPAPVAPNQPANARGADASQNGSVSFSTPCGDSTFPVSLMNVELAGCGANISCEPDHHAPGQSSGQAERSLNSTSSRSDSNISVGVNSRGSGNYSIVCVNSSTCSGSGQSSVVSANSSSSGSGNASIVCVHNSSNSVGANSSSSGSGNNSIVGVNSSSSGRSSGISSGISSVSIITVSSSSSSSSGIVDTFSSGSSSTSRSIDGVNGSVGSGSSASSASNSLPSGNYNTSINSTVYPNNTRFSHIAGSSSTTASSQNGTTSSMSSSPPPPRTGQSSFAIAAQTTPKRTVALASLSPSVISPVPASQSFNSIGCFATSTPTSSPVSCKYDNLGILTPATSPKLVGTNIGHDSGQQQLLAASGGGTTPAEAVAMPLPPAPPVAMPSLTANVVGGTAAAGAGEPVGIALVVSSIGGCSEIGSNHSPAVTTASSTNNAAVLSAPSATSQLYAEET